MKEAEDNLGRKTRQEQGQQLKVDVGDHSVPSYGLFSDRRVNRECFGRRPKAGKFSKEDESLASHQHGLVASCLTRFPKQVDIKEKEEATEMMKEELVSIGQQVDSHLAVAPEVCH